MKLPPEAIEELRAAWRASFREDISPEEAEIEGSQLLNTFSLLFNENKHEQYGKLKIT